MLIPWFVLIFEGICASFFSENLPENDSTFCMIIIFINLIAVVVAINEQRKDKNTTLIMLGGLMFRVFLLLWDLNFSDVYRLPNSGQDTESYAFWARSGFLTGDYMRGGTYAQFIAFWYRFFGVQRPIAQYVNIVLAISTIIVVVKIMNYLEVDDIIQKTAITLMSFLPNFTITNSILLRETLIVFLLSVGIYAFVRWIYEDNLLYVLASIVIVCLAASVHSGAIAILLGEAMIFVLYDRRNHSIRLHLGSIVGLVIVIIGFIVIYSQFGDVLFAKFQGIESAADVVGTADKYNAGSSSYDVGFAINNSVTSLIVNTPIRMFYFVASPLPWSWRGLSDIIAFCFSSTVFIYAYARAIKEIRISEPSDRKTMIILFTILALSSALIFAWGVSNAGTAVRHREKFVTIYIMLIALCNDNRCRRMAE